MKLKLLLPIILILAGAVIYIAVKDKTVSSTSEDASLPFKNIDVEAIKEISIKDPNGIVYILSEDDKWCLKERDNFPADMKKIDNLIISLFSLDKSQFITDNPAKYADLNVTDSEGTILRLSDKKDNNIGTVIIGKEKTFTKGAGHFVRYNNEKEVYLVPQEFHIKTDIKEYMDVYLLDIKKKDIKSLSLLNASNNKPKIDLLREDKDGKFIVSNFPKGKKVDEGAKNRLLNVFSSLSIEDVLNKGAEEENNIDFNKGVKAELVLLDTTQFSFNVCEVGDSYYLALEPGLIDESSYNETEKQEERYMDAKKHITRINSKYSDRTFILPKNKGEIFFWDMNNLIKEEKKVEKKEEQKPLITEPKKEEKINPNNFTKIN